MVCLDLNTYSNLGQIYLYQTMAIRRQMCCIALPLLKFLMVHQPFTLPFVSKSAIVLQTLLRIQLKHHGSDLMVLHTQFYCYPISVHLLVSYECDTQANVECSPFSSMFLIHMSKEYGVVLILYLFHFINIS